MEKFKEQWKIFLAVLVEPWTLILLIMTGFMLGFSFTQNQLALNKSSFFSFTMFPFLIALASAIIGGRIAKQLTAMQEEKVLVTRGQIAIRQLKLLFTNLTKLENRLKTYLKRHNNKQPSSEGKIYFEEIIEKLWIIEEEIINSIEDWTDIISDANIKNHIEAFIDLKLALYYLHKEIERMNNDIKKSRGPAQKGIQELKLKIKENEKEISQLQKNLLERKQMMNNSILSGIANPILNSGISSFGNSFPEPNLISAFSAGSDDGNNQQSPVEVLSLDNLTEVQKGKTGFKNNRKSD